MGSRGGFHQAHLEPRQYAQSEWDTFATLFKITYNFYYCHPATFLGRVTMPTRSEILDTLATSQEKVTGYFQGLIPEELERPCTASAVPGEAAWRAKDHFAHLAENESNIQILRRPTLTGHMPQPALFRPISRCRGLVLRYPPPQSHSETTH